MRGCPRQVDGVGVPSLGAGVSGATGAGSGVITAASLRPCDVARNARDSGDGVIDSTAWTTGAATSEIFFFTAVVVLVTLADAFLAAALTCATGFLVAALTLATGFLVAALTCAFT